MSDLSGHVEYVCPGDHDNYGCQFCDGGLFACTVCGAFEGATPDQCPGLQMTKGQATAVYAGLLNYRDGSWRDECCAIMRPTHDKASYMAEMGYVHVDTEVGGRWVKTTAPEVTGVNQ